MPVCFTSAYWLTVTVWKTTQLELEQRPLEVQLEIPSVICSAVVEDAEHFILTCSGLAEDRRRLLNDAQPSIVHQCLYIPFNLLRLY